MKFTNARIWSPDLSKKPKELTAPAPDENAAQYLAFSSDAIVSSKLFRVGLEQRP